MKQRLFPRVCFSVLLIISFLFMPVVTAYADTGSDERTFWHWFAVENIPKYNGEHGGGGFADVSEASSEEMGVSTEQFIYNHTGMTGDEFVNSVYNPIGYGVQHDYSSFFSVPVTPDAKSTYSAQKTLRTDSEGNVNVSGSDFWHSVYNKWFSSKNSYKTTYDEENNGVKVQYDEFNAIIININYGNKNYSWSYNAGTNSIANSVLSSPNSFCLSYGTTTTKADIIPLFSITLETNNGTVTVYKPLTYLHNETVSMENNGGLIIKNVQASSSKIIVVFGREGGTNYQFEINLKSGFSYDQTTNNTNQIPRPAHVGFIKYPLGGSTDISYDDFPYQINDNGTVTVVDNDTGTSTDYPIYVNPSDITPDGWEIMLEFADGSDQNTSDYDDNGFPWNTQNDGTALGGFFSNIIRDISNMFRGIGDTIKNLFKKPSEIISDLVEKIKQAMKEFIEEFIGDFSMQDVDNLDVTNPFSLVQTCYNTLLEIMGVGSQ